MYWCFSGTLPDLLVQGLALGSNSSRGYWQNSTNLADRMYWRIRLKVLSFTLCKKTQLLLQTERQTHTDKQKLKERYSQPVFWVWPKWQTDQVTAGESWTRTPSVCHTYSSWKSRRGQEEFLHERHRDRGWEQQRQQTKALFYTVVSYELRVCTVACEAKVAEKLSETPMDKHCKYKKFKYLSHWRHCVEHKLSLRIQLNVSITFRNAQTFTLFLLTGVSCLWVRRDALNW